MTEIIEKYRQLGATQGLMEKMIKSIEDDAHKFLRDMGWIYLKGFSAKCQETLFYSQKLGVVMNFENAIAKQKGEQK